MAACSIIVVPGSNGIIVKPSKTTIKDIIMISILSQNLDVYINSKTHLKIVSHDNIERFGYR